MAKIITEDINDGTFRNNKKHVVLPNTVLSQLKKINPNIPADVLESTAETLKSTHTLTEIININYDNYKKIREKI